MRDPFNRWKRALIAIAGMATFAAVILRYEPYIPTQVSEDSLSLASDASLGPEWRANNDVVASDRRVGRSAESKERANMVMDPAATGQTLLRSFESAISARSAQAVIDEARELGLEIARDWQIQLDSVCTKDMTGPIKESAEASAADWHRDRLVSYCDGHVPRIDWSRVRELNAEGWFAETRQERYLDDAMKAISDSADADEATRVVARLIAETEYPADVEAMRSLLTDIRAHGMDLGPNELSAQIPAFGDRAKVMGAALSLLRCDVFGGCGPTSAQTLSACVMLGHCEPYWSMHDVVRSTLTPPEYAAALRAANWLRQQRSG